MISLGHIPSQIHNKVLKEPLSWFLGNLCDHLLFLEQNIESLKKMKWTDRTWRRKLDEKLRIHFIWPNEWSADKRSRSVCIHVVKVQSRLSCNNGELLISNFSKRRVIYFISFNSNQHVTIIIWQLYNRVWEMC